MAPLNTASLVQTLRDSSARWTGGKPPQSKLTDDEKKALLGVFFTPEAGEMAATPPAASARAGPPSYAPAVDWRNRNGNHVTSVKDQQHCGSCVSFCCTA